MLNFDRGLVINIKGKTLDYIEKIDEEILLWCTDKTVIKFSPMTKEGNLPCIGMSYANLKKSDIKYVKNE